MPDYKPPQAGPDVVRILQEYRVALDAREASLMDDMGRKWLTIENKLEADISALAFETALRKEQGAVITEQMVWRMERYKTIQSLMEAEISKYNKDYAVNAISQAQEHNALLGINAAGEAIQKSIGKPWAAFTRVNTRAVQSMIGFAGDGSPLNTLLKNAFPDAVDGLLGALINGTARGQGAVQTARDMVEGMGMALERALLIARTESARAYRAGSIEQYRKSGVVSGFKRLVKKETACMACLMLDGEKFALDNELSDHPRGKCIVVPIVEGVDEPEWQTGQEYFKTLSPEEQAVKMGAEKYQLWKEGQFELGDLAKLRSSDIWGSSPRVATISELIEIQNKSSEEIYKKESLFKKIQNISSSEVIKLGNLNPSIVDVWSSDIDNNLSIVLTGNQRLHYLKSHSEIYKYESELINTLTNPNEVHRNKEDEMMAIFYKRIDDSHYLRATVIMQKNSALRKHSVVSFRVAGEKEINQGRKAGRLVWEKK